MGFIFKALSEQTYNINELVNMPNLFGITSRSTSSGITVTDKTAMQLSAVYAAVQLLSKVMATTPLILYKDRKKGNKSSGKDRMATHPLYSVLKESPVHYMTSFHFKECMMVCNLLGGNSYAYIQRNKKGECMGLQYIPYNYVKIVVDDDKIRYRVTINAKERLFDYDEILHIPSMSYDGVNGLSVIDIARETIGKGLALQDYGSKFFANGAHLSGVFQHPNSLSDEAYKRLKADITENYSGVGNSNKTMILEENMNYIPVSISPEQSQFLESMKFNVSDIARIFGVPAHLIGDLEKATFSNIEQQDIEFIKYSMLPWYTRYEQYINLKCLTAEEREDGYFCEFLPDAMLKGDSKSRAAMYHIMRQDGILNADEWRELENMNPSEDGNGGIYFINGNMVPIENAKSQKGGGSVGAERS